jgi:excisionase family DNA binding protein
MPNHNLPPDVFEAVVNALAEALVNDYRSQHVGRAAAVPSPQASSTPPLSSPWLTMKEAAARSRCGVGTLLREVRAGRLRAVRVGGRRTIRLKAEWIDTWLEAQELPRRERRRG